MFTGIIEYKGVISKILADGSNKSFWIRSPLANHLKIDQSLSHNGVCLTVEQVENDLHKVTAVKETLSKTNLGSWVVGTLVNLERCMVLGDRLDGHLVQGHVDCTGKLVSIKPAAGSWEMKFQFPKKFAGLLVEKGSICVNGISLTAFDIKKKSFTVTIIPYTWEHTNMHTLVEGDTVNLEFDIIGKYLLRNLTLGN